MRKELAILDLPMELEYIVQMYYEAPKILFHDCFLVGLYQKNATQMFGDHDFKNRFLKQREIPGSNYRGTIHQDDLHQMIQPHEVRFEDIRYEFYYQKQYMQDNLNRTRLKKINEIEFPKLYQLLLKCLSYPDELKHYIFSTQPTRSLLYSVIITHCIQPQIALSNFLYLMEK